MNTLKLFFLGLALVCTTINGIAAEIKWEIGNRYRAFDFLNASGVLDLEKSARLFDSMIPASSEEDFQQWINRILGNGGSPFAVNSGPWNESTARYDKKFVELPSKILLKLSVLPNSADAPLASKDCEWFVGGLPPIGSKCIDQVAIAIPPIEVEVSVRLDQTVLATTVIAPKLKRVLGFGDSYGAGEGSPDVPTQWDKVEFPATWPFGSEQAINSWVKSPAVWWSPRCNRSFFSYQNLVALRLAAEDPHAIVSFVHLACAGAEVVDGLLAPQRMAPGHPRHRCLSPEKRPNGQESKVDPRCDVPLSQLRAAVELLCPIDSTNLSSKELDAIRGPLKKLRYAADEASWITDLVKCSGNQILPIDLMLLSIGGNDMGFAGVIGWGLLPSDPHNIISKAVVRIARKKEHVVCPYANAFGGCNGLNAQERIAEIPKRLMTLNLAFSKILRVNQRDVVTTQYTNPLLDQNGTMCGDKPNMNADNAWYASRIVVPVAPYSWQINLTAWEGAQVNDFVIPKLNEAIRRGSEALGWRSVDTSSVMYKRGWCAGDQVKLGAPHDLLTWNGLSDHVRYIRTANDAIRTQWPGLADRDDGLYGTFHPNVQGYAAIAQQVYGVVGPHRPK